MKKRELICAFVIGLLASGAILTLMAFGVSGVLVVHKIDLMYVFWPASIILTVGWRTTFSGITTTLIAVLLNSLTYLGVAVLARATLRGILRIRGAGPPFSYH